MGLDMYAVTVAGKDAVGPFEIRKSEGVETLLLAKWRKHAYLHGWFFALAKAKGFEGSETDFNCVPVKIEMSDLALLEADIRKRRMPETHGFFFGNFPPDDETDQEDLAFVARAREAIKAGLAVYYDSWW